jgi:hypothetical protein
MRKIIRLGFQGNLIHFSWQYAAAKLRPCTAGFNHQANTASGDYLDTPWIFSWILLTPQTFDWLTGQSHRLGIIDGEVYCRHLED